MKEYQLSTIAFACIATVLSSSHAQVHANSNKQNSHKNILMIAVDDLKPLLGCYGDPLAQTPHIDRLASQGALFTQAYCQQAVSAATRASLLTGMCPDRTRVWDLKTKIRSQNPDVVTLPQHFKENGYTVAGIGKIFDPRSVDKQMDEQSWSAPYMDYVAFLNPTFGEPAMSQYQSNETKMLFEKYEKEAKDKGIKRRNEIQKYVQKHIKPTTECVVVPDNAYTDGAVAEGAMAFLNRYDQEEPFFLAVGFKKPHLPFCAPKKYWDLYKRSEIPLASFRKKAEDSPEFAYHSCGELQSYSDIPSLITFSDINNAQLPDHKAKELIHGYYACISYIDAQIGKILTALKKQGLDKNTIIVLWGDHGWHLGDHGLWNKHTNFEQANHVPLLIVDPSLQSQKIENPVEYLSIFPTLCDLAHIDVPDNLDGVSLSSIIQGGKKEIPPYAVSQYPRVGKMGYSIRSDRYRYTVWVEWKNRKLNPNKIIAQELYDYQEDPLETKNLVSQAEYANALIQMKEYWQEYKQRRIFIQ